jgi:hypothetical protein
MSWFRQHRILIVLYSVGLAAGVREYMIKRANPPFEWPTPQGEVLLDVLDQLNPADPDVQYLKAMRALSKGEEDEFRTLLDAALATEARHNELMLRFHAEYLLSRGADPVDVNAALNRWRRNFPFSAEPIQMRLPTGPTTVRQAEALEYALAQIPWMSDVRLGRVVEGDSAQWTVQMMIRRGREIDIRHVLDAVEFSLTR